jgi:hypothetical protein
VTTTAITDWTELASRECDGLGRGLCFGDETRESLELQPQTFVAERSAD